MPTLNIDIGIERADICITSNGTYTEPGMQELGVTHSLHKQIHVRLILREHYIDIQESSEV